MLLRLALGALGAVELRCPCRTVDLCMNLAARNEGVELRPWVYTAARVEGILVLLWVLSSLRRE